jgi:uncharacterized sulfatase
MLGEAGYRTGLIGKWNLGDAPEYLPLQHGFDEFQGIPYSNNMHPLYFMEGNQKLKSPEPIPAHMTSRFTEQARDFIQRHREVPFFLLLAHPMPHYPIDSAGTWRGSSRDGRYGDVVQELDWSVGQIVACLENLGLADDSVLFFTSDNGSWRGRSNRPLRGKKRTGWEGGFRVPLIAWAPGRFQSGTVTDRPSMMFDLYSTSLRLAGVEPPSDLAIDGKSLLPLMDGSPSGPGDRAPLDALFFFRYGQINAVRAGRWKLHVGRTSPLFGRRGIGELYDLTEDLKEQINLANRRPGVVEHLTHEIESFEWKLEIRD